jgi:hypothetical protein
VQTDREDPAIGAAVYVRRLVDLGRAAHPGEVRPALAPSE